MSSYPFSQVNVFSANPLTGNPLAVVHEADGIGEHQMLALARWTNLSETTFLLKPTTPDADYRVRIFSPAGELPFAGHPTLGSCHAWLSGGGIPRHKDHIFQQCNVGLVPIRPGNSRLEFAAPPLIRSGPVEDETLEKIARALDLSPTDLIHHQWVDNGPGWCAVMLDSARKVLSVKPDWAALYPLNLGIVGLHDPGGDATVEVRAFIGDGGYEDPVTGSLNASLAQWLVGAGLVKSPYIAAQGRVIGREGRVHLRESAGDIWVGGEVVGVINGDIEL